MCIIMICRIHQKQKVRLFANATIIYMKKSSETYSKILKIDRFELGWKTDKMMAPVHVCLLILASAKAK